MSPIILTLVMAVIGTITLGGMWLSVFFMAREGHRVTAG
jgi:hypothetical protein